MQGAERGRFALRGYRSTVFRFQSSVLALVRVPLSCAVSSELACSSGLLTAKYRSRKHPQATFGSYRIGSS